MRRTRSAEERAFYEAEALRGGWSVRQLDRQIGSQFHTRAMLSKNKQAMLQKASKAQPGDLVTAEEAIKDPYDSGRSTAASLLVRKQRDLLSTKGNPDGA
jgi:predicted nuclease of restriction endonuclease-like (RecB) superfamily